MSDAVIVVKDVSKKYRLFDSRQDRLKEALHPLSRHYHREFWALKGVSFEVQRGETVGILGRNGSGKSTLLQIVAGIMQPSGGEVVVNGRVSALLELGAGFNPEFTGRENVIFQAQVMGLSRREIEQQLGEVEAFADIGEFFDQPVKTYSSGMFVRVAFASAINVNPDILIVDETLAVGDVRFQHKCFRIFTEFQQKKKTILFVTHNIDAIVKHCDRALLLDDGGVLEDSFPKHVVDRYLELMFTGQLDAYSSLPRLVEEGCAGFNIFQFRKEYFAIAQRLRSLDLLRVPEERLNQYRTEGFVYVARSLQELKETIAAQNYNGDRNLARNEPSGGSASIDVCDASTEVRAFLAENILEDRCSSHRSFNPSEYRYGDRRAEILDYLLIANGVADPLTVQSGATCVLYMKVLYRSNVNWPMFGLAIKTVDGQTVNGINTMMTGTILAPVTENQIVHVRFEWEAWLNGGDYFIDLGCAEVQNGESAPLDRRYGLVHIVVETREHFTGQANLRASVTEVSRLSSVFTK
jgi:ABC-type polysaccharide/polyol phosphate transport system ATPase subunit